MILQKLILSNIRSYENLELDFQKGSTLLSGDIGSGKTTILLSIEFAIFGVMRGFMNASSLLRNGADSGKVYLKFKVNDNDIEIERTLKRSKAGISQGSGYISFNGDAVDGTAIELKSKIISLLGYPEELVNKSKNLLFRYTVYTPQEEMKAIIFDSAESRFEKLRTIFGIDKYKKIKENSYIYTRKLRQDLKALDDSLSEIKELQNKLQELQSQSEETSKEIVLLEKRKEEIAKIKADFEKDLAAAENTYQKFISYEKSIENSKRFRQSKLSELESVKKQIESIESEIKELENIKKPKDEPQDVQKLDDKLNELNENYKAVQANELKARNNISKLKANKESSEDIITKIFELDNCPICKQEVGETHKKEVEKEEKNKISTIDEKITKFTEYLDKANKKKEEYELKITKLRELKNTQNYIKKEWLRFEKDKALLSKRKEELTKNNEKVIFLNKEIEELNLELKQGIEWLNKHKEIKDKRTSLKEKVDLHSQKLQEILSKYSAYVERKKNIQTRINETNESLDSLKRKREELQKKSVLESWLSTHFTGVISDIEKEVFANIHSQFNEIFKDWFDMLLEDETITVHLSEDFTPLISQNGHDIDVGDLSGGEKTAVALAYRLSLNKVINDYVGTINTRNLIILDEPTDGFSSDQLDTLRDVLERLDIAQILIVSHEKKLESMVDRIIKVEKQNHVSQVVSY